jgi:hypothetical protein
MREERKEARKGGKKRQREGEGGRERGREGRREGGLIRESYTPPCMYLKCIRHNCVSVIQF